MIKLIFPDSYKRREKKFFKKHPELVSQYAKVLKLLSANPAHPSLRLHWIEKKKLYSVSINMSYRVMITIRVKEDGTISFIDIGNHDTVY